MNLNLTLLMHAISTALLVIAIYGLDTAAKYIKEYLNYES